MNKFEQIEKLAQAAMLIQEVISHIANPDHADELNIIHDDLADLADEIEEDDEEWERQPLSQSGFGSREL